MWRKNTAVLRMYNFYVAIIVQSIWFYVFLLFFRVEERMSGSDMSGYTDKDINTAKQLPKVEYLSFCKKHYSQKFILNCLIYSHNYDIKQNYNPYN